MPETYLVLWKTPANGFPAGHLFMHITKGKLYEVKQKSMHSRLISDDLGTDIWVSGSMFKKFFKEKQK